MLLGTLLHFLTEWLFLQFLKKCPRFHEITHLSTSRLVLTLTYDDFITSQTVDNGLGELCHCHEGCVSLTRN